jgi:hypothetical protein
MNTERKLTKSRFKLAMECPGKLYYTHKAEYPDSRAEDPFLQALAEGGFQVGELAKLYYPEGHNISSLDQAKSLEETNELLKQENVTIFEAAVIYQNLFIRIDILEKRGKRVKLIEVKAKSADEDLPGEFYTQKGGISSKWSPYLFDAVFQQHVLRKAFPQYNISTYLMLADKTKKASVDGLNQRFFLQHDESGRVRVKVTDRSDPGEKILRAIDIGDAVTIINNTRFDIENKDLSFEEYITYLADAYESDRRIYAPIGPYCKDCEFNPDETELTDFIKSGFRECMKEKAGFEDIDFKRDLIFGLWNFRKKQECIDEGIYFLEDIDESMLGEDKPGDSPGLTPRERQALQIQKTKDNDSTPYIDIQGIRAEMDKWVYPLHFIDFETTMAAIPFNRGRRPYEGIAFQFSHHVVNDDGTIEHRGQFLNTKQGEFPNYNFVRALNKELETDNGSIFRYASHENTYLNIIHYQLREEEAQEIPDKQELLNFIEEITHLKNGKALVRKGIRDMIDLLEIVKRYYYHPMMKGSNSIKAVLPSILESPYIQEKYSKPVYGSSGPGGIKSLNFRDWAWVRYDQAGQIRSPYKLLPPVFEGVDDDLLDGFISDPEVAEGGAAMMAYSRMQFTEMSELERMKIAEGLLRYCELDTFAMVMLAEGWREE